MFIKNIKILWDDPHSLESAEISLDPVQEKLFDQDIFEYDNKKATLCHSSVRQMTNIPGVLVLSGNKTYGSSKKGTYFYNVRQLGHTRR